MIDLNKLPKIRNREQARAFSKILKKSGKTETEINNIIDLTKKVTLMYDTEQLVKFKNYLLEGDKVKLNADKIRNHPDWDKLQEAYREFIISNVDTVFSVKYDENYPDKPNMVRLEDETELYNWLFWDGDLYVLDENDGQYKELYLIEESKIG